MNQEKKCPICGEPTYLVYGKHPRKDGLCKKHSQMLFNGELAECEKCKTFYEIIHGCKKCKQKEEKQIEQNEKNETNCIICGKPSKGRTQCKDCYHETQNHMDNLDKNSSVRKLRDHYYNLKERIVIINSLEEVKNQCNRLIAIAMLNCNINDDNSLFDRVYTDVEKIIKIKEEKEIKPKNTEQKVEQQEKDENKSKINTAQDGHNVDSDMEVRIDDILYGAFILHSYGKNINEILEKRKKCDWFVPIANGEGIYIEYWGKDTAKYIQDRKEKEELYKKYNIPYIGIEKDDPKQDTQTFTNNLLRELNSIAIERFGFMPKWKK